MTIRKNKFGSYTVYCNECNDFLDTIEDDPKDAWQDAKKAGWCIKTTGDFYRYSSALHYCPECWEKMSNER